MRLRRGLYDLTNEGRITPGTANLTLSHLRGIVRTMYGMGLVSDQQLAVAHPKMLKSIPGSRKVRGRMLSMLEEQDLRFAARSLNGYRGRMLDTAIVLAIGLGLRREEVASADLGGIRPGSLAIIGKGNRERQLVVDPQIEQALDQWLRERERLAPGHSKIFCSPWRPNFVLSAWSFWTLVRAASHAAFGTRPQCEDGCECLDVVTGPHDFRRTFASRLLERGLDIREVQLLMGHESPETTARYDHRGEDALVKKRHGMRIVAELG
jgi:site-specific recombinase XerD